MATSTGGPGVDGTVGIPAQVGVHWAERRLRCHSAIRRSGGRTGARQWREIGAPYELARARELVGRALRALGDEASAAAEFHAAIAEFERLGASRDADRARALAEDTAIARPE